MQSNNNKSAIENMPEFEVLFGKARAAAFAIAVYVFIASASQYLVMTAMIITIIACLILTLPFVGYERKNYMKAQAKARREKIKIRQKHIGLISFFKNRIGIIADILLLASIGATVLLVLLDCNNILLWSLTRAVGVYAIQSHCLYNGQIYNAFFNQEYIERRKT